MERKVLHKSGKCFRIITGTEWLNIFFIYTFKLEGKGKQTSSDITKWE